MLIAFPLQQWLHERALMLRYAYVARFVTFFLSFFVGTIVPCRRTVLWDAIFTINDVELNSQHYFAQAYQCPNE